MRIQELLEQTIAPQPPGFGLPTQPTQPTAGPPNTSNSPTPNTAQPPSTATLGQPTASPSAPTTPNASPTTTPQKDFDSLRNQITTLQTMIAKQMQMQQQQSTNPGQS
jgi:hypothetical protein